LTDFLKNTRFLLMIGDQTIGKVSRDKKQVETTE